MTNKTKVVERFANLFQSNTRSIGRYEAQNGRMHTEYRAPESGDFSGHLNGKTGLGLVPILDDGNCWWAAIDIDNHGSEEDLPIEAVDKAILTNKLPLIACRSKSGGIHCYLFLEEPKPCSQIRALMAQWAAALGYTGSEVFPKQSVLRKQNSGKKQLGNWINLPYFKARDTDRPAIRAGKKLTVEQFVQQAEKMRAGDEELATYQLLEHQQAPPCVQKMLTQGVDAGMRNEALYNTVIYLRKAFPDDFEEKARSVNTSMFPRPLPRAEATRTIASAARPDYSYRCSEEPIRGLCDRETCLKRKFGITGDDLNRLDTEEKIPAFSELTKYVSEPTKWELRIDGVKIGNITTAQLLDWRTMREAIAEKLMRVVPLIKPVEWERILQPLMQEARVIETPDDASVSGVIRDRLREFAARIDLTSRGEDTKDRAALTRGMPVVAKVEKEGGVRCVCFRANDFVTYLKRTKSEELKGTNLWMAVKDMGVGHTKMRISNTKTVNVWYLPIDEVLTDATTVEKPIITSEI